MPIVMGILSCLMIGGLGGCALSPEEPTNLQLSSIAGSESNSQIAQTNTQTSSQKNSQTKTGTRSSRYSTPGQTFTCQTQNYFAQITWQETQPYLQFGRGPSDISSTATATENQASDGSVSYTSQKDQTITVRFLTSGGCNIRVADLNGSVRINESGQVGNSGSSGGGSQTNQGYWAGYNRGYRRGYRDGRNSRLYNSGYNPNSFFQSGSQTNNPDFDEGFRVGYFRGFDDGYNSVVVRPKPTPEPDYGNDDWNDDSGISASW